MNDWARNQFMAPVYALVISFAVSLLLGAALVPKQVGPPAAQSSETTVPARGEWRANFVTPVGEAVKELRNLAVRVESDAGQEFEVDENGTFSFGSAVGWPVTICATLPARWKSPDPRYPGADGRTCWKASEPLNSEPVRLVVIRDGG